VREKLAIGALSASFDGGFSGATGGSAASFC
jgi:hypothetical protein